MPESLMADVLDTAISDSSSVEVLEYLLEQYFPVNRISGKDDCSPLHIAAKEEPYSSVTILLKNSANKNARWSRGRTAFHYAFQNHYLLLYTDVLDQLVTESSSVNCATDFGILPTSMVSSSGSQRDNYASGRSFLENDDRYLEHITKSRGFNLDFRVLISSLSSIVGQMGQANYSSANIFLNAFSSFSITQGLPCTTITFGVMEGIGVMSNNIDLLKTLQGSGWQLNNESELIEVVDSAIQLQTIKRALNINETFSPTGVNAVDKTRFIFELCPTVRLDSPDSYTNIQADVRIAVYHNSERQSNNKAVADDALRTLLSRAKKTASVLETAESVSLLAMKIKKKLCSLLLLPDNDLSTTMKMGEMGLDSMVAVEMGAWWKFTCGLEIICWSS